MSLGLVRFPLNPADWTVLNLKEVKIFHNFFSISSYPYGSGIIEQDLRGCEKCNDHFR
jgi:hypothetical protein